MANLDNGTVRLWAVIAYGVVQGIYTTEAGRNAKMAALGWLRVHTTYQAVTLDDGAMLTVGAAQ